MIAWLAANRLRAAVLVGAGVVSIATLAVGGLLMMPAETTPEQVSLAMALEALDSGAYEEARELAEKLRERGDLSTAEYGGPSFVRGAAAANEVEMAWSEKRRHQLHALAAHHLEDARDRGFPQGREGQGLYLLGRSLLFGGKAAASQSVLREALQENPEKQYEIHRLLTDAYLQDPNPQPEEALEHIVAYLDNPGLIPKQQQDGLLVQGGILLQLGRTDACREVLDRLAQSGADRAEALVLEARLLMDQAKTHGDDPAVAADDPTSARQMYRQAIALLQRAQQRDTLSAQATHQAMYLIGLCSLELNDYRTALAQFTRTAELYGDSPEALAANVQVAELSRRLGRNTQALTSYRAVLDAIADPKNYSNRWISREQLRAVLLEAYRHYAQTQQFELASQLARRLSPLFPRATALELTAAAHRQWGESLLIQADAVEPDKAEALRETARAQWRRAADFYASLAQEQIATREYPDWLWQTAEAYQQGHDYRNAVRVLRQYLKIETRRRHPQALVYLGEALLALERIDDALTALQECIEFHPRDAAAFRARLLASEGCLEKGKPDRAEALLLENLQGEYLTPASREWADSLFALGMLLHQQGRYDDATVRLEEAVERYPSDPQAIRTRYLLADAFRRRADMRRDQLDADLTLSQRGSVARQIEQDYTQSLGHYRHVQESLRRQQEAGPLQPLPRALLRNTYFAIGGLLFDLGDYEAAVRAYTAATNRYQDQPEVLEAYVRIAAAYRRLGKQREARSTLEQAKVVLGRIRHDAAFEKTGNYTRKQWNDRLEWLIEQYRS